MLIHQLYHIQLYTKYPPILTFPGVGDSEVKSLIIVTDDVPSLLNSVRSPSILLVALESLPRKDAKIILLPLSKPIAACQA